MAVIPDFKSATLLAFLKQNVATGSAVYTDSLKSFTGLREAGFEHVPRIQPLRIDLRKGAKSVVPLADRAIGNLQQWLIGTHHGVSRGQLPVYLDEFVFRHNRRKNPMAAFQTLIGLGSARNPTPYDKIRGAADLAYTWVAYRFGTIHLTIAACIAPFLLLRTPDSVKLSLRWAGLYEYIEQVRTDPPRHGFVVLPGPDNALGFLLYGGLGLLLGLAMFQVLVFFSLARIAATLVCLFRRPLYTIQHIPHNWWRFVACIDVGCLPEVLPGAIVEERRLGIEGSIYNPIPQLLLFSGFTVGDRKPDRKDNALLGGILLGEIIWLVLPAWLYRLSIKGTSQLLSPLIWIVHSSFSRNAYDVRDRAYHTTVRWYSSFVLTLFLAKLLQHTLGLSPGSPKWFEEIWNHAVQHPLIAAYLMPSAFPPWQIALAISAASAFLLYWNADYQVAHPDQTWREPVQRFGYLVRGLLSVYVILCTVTWRRARCLNGISNLSARTCFRRGPFESKTIRNVCWYCPVLTHGVPAVSNERPRCIIGHLSVIPRNRRCAFLKISRRNSSSDR